MTPTTIYLVTNKISGTQYVGFTTKPLSERNNNAKPIITPYGKFGSIKTAEKELKEKGINLSYKQIWYRLNKQNDWNYTL